jgi:ketosteroid isomerase-like protein
MRKVILALAAAFAATPLAVGHAATSDQNDVMAAVKQFDDSFNKGDMNVAVSACAPQTIIIDDFPPHAWQGANSCSSWWTALFAYDKAAGMSNENVTIGAPRHVDVTGDRAYVVVPATYTYKQKGKPVTESDAVWTFAMQKLASGWRIAGWAWAQH